MSIRVPVCYTHPNDPSYNNNSYDYNGSVYIAPGGSNHVPPSGNAFITPILGVTYSDGVYSESRTGLDSQTTEREHRSRDKSSDSSNNSPSRLARKKSRREQANKTKQEGGFLNKQAGLSKKPSKQ